MAHEAKRGPRPLILKCERAQWKAENGIPRRSRPKREGQTHPTSLLARFRPS